MSDAMLRLVVGRETPTPVGDPQTYSTGVPRQAARRLLTDERARLLATLAEDECESIRALADAVDRDEAAVHRDVDLLDTHNVVTIERDGRCQRPTLPYESVYMHIPLVGQPTVAAPPQAATDGQQQAAGEDGDGGGWAATRAEEPATIERGDVLMTAHGPLAALAGERSPDHGDAYVGVELRQMRPEMAAETQRIDAEAWEVGPDEVCWALCWRVQHVAEYSTYVGRLSNNVMNDLSVSISRYIGPVRG